MGTPVISVSKAGGRSACCLGNRPHRPGRTLGDSATAYVPTALGLSDDGAERRLPGLGRRARAHGRPLGRAGAAGAVGARRRPGPGVHTQRPALLGARQPAAREVGIPGRGAARPHAPAVLHALGRPGPVRPGRLAGLRDPAAVVARRRVRPVPAGDGAGLERRWRSTRRRSPRRPGPSSTSSGPSARPTLPGGC